MTVINQLSGADQLAAGDSVPFYSVAQGDTRRFTMSTLEAYMADANFVYRYFQTWAEFLLSDGWKDQDIFLVSAEDTGTHDSVAGDVGEAAGQTPNVGVFRYSILLTTGVRISDTDAQVAKYWADQSAASAAAALASANAALVTLGDVNTAGTTQVAAVNTAGSTQVAAVTSEGATQVAAVNDAGLIQTANAAAQATLAALSADEAEGFAATAGGASVDNLFDIFSQVTVNPPETASTIQSNGWEIINSAPADVSLGAVKVVRKGYSTAALPVAWVDTLYRTKRVRQAYPNHASFTATEESLSDYVYSTDFVFGLANQSTETSPKPIANWVMPSRLTVASLVHWEIAGFHKDGRPLGAGGVGQQVACVKVRATNGTTSTAWQTVSATSLSTYCEWVRAPEVFAGDLDVSAFTDGAMIWLEAEVYPWFGTAASVLKSEDNQTAGVLGRGFVRRYFRKDATRAATFYKAYVASTGNDTTGVASTNDATAAATPCLTVQGALTKIRTAAGLTRGAMDNAHIYIVDSVNQGNVSAITFYQDVGGIIVTRASGSTRAAALITTTASLRPFFTDHTSGLTEGALIYTDVSLKIGGAHSIQGEATNRIFTQFWNCNLDCNNQASNLRNNSHLALFGVALANGASVLGITISTAEQRGIFGVTADLANGSPDGFAVIGSTLTRCSAPSLSDASANGHIWYNNFYPNPHTNPPLHYKGTVSGGNLGSIAVVQNLVENLSTVNGPTLRISGDSDFGNVTHAVIIHNTIVGDDDYGRTNIVYDEHPTVARFHKFTAYKGNLTTSDNVKLDIFTSNATRLGGFAFHHGVGCSGNFSLSPNSAGGGISFGQAYGGIGTLIAGGDPLFTNYQGVNATGPVAGVGGGTYTLQAGSPARDILAKPLLKYDYAGASRGTGTQDAGCYA